MTVTADEWLEAWEERAAILEYEAGFSRTEAELRAWDMVKRELGPPPQRNSATGKEQTR